MTLISTRNKSGTHELRKNQGFESSEIWGMLKFFCAIIE
jgi:hypothetical protein